MESTITRKNFIFEEKILSLKNGFILEGFNIRAPDKMEYFVITADNFC